MIDSFACFGSTCTVDIDGADVAEARETLLSWHERVTRFDPASELSRFNADPRAEIPVTPLPARLAAAARWAAELSGGLVDSTLLGDLERAGYGEDLSTSLDLRETLARAPRRKAARPAPEPPAIDVDFERLTVRRAPGLRLDSGGLAKGVFADASPRRSPAAASPSTARATCASAGGSGTCTCAGRSRTTCCTPSASPTPA